MAQFYAEIQGSRGEATRMGSKQSGMRSHTRGWHIGAEVLCQHLNDTDHILITATGGSTGCSQHKRDIARIVERQDGYSIELLSESGAIVDEIRVYH